jgi:hypothetical protein
LIAEIVADGEKKENDLADEQNSDQQTIGR